MKNMGEKNIRHLSHVQMFAGTTLRKFCGWRREVEMNVVFEEEEWEEERESRRRMTNSPTWREFSWKLEMRYFKTPFIMSKYGRS